LHDIGKFYQRADTGSVSTSRYLSPQNKVESTFLPLHKGIYSHKHCLWTAQFIDDHRDIFNQLSIGLDDTQNVDNLLYLSAQHHLQKQQLSSLGQILKEADCLSSGMDRDSEEALKDDQDVTGWDQFRKKRMTSVLETICLGEAKLKEKKDWWHLPVAKISFLIRIIPICGRLLSPISSLYRRQSAVPLLNHS
jgi:CRISPR-associated protein Csm1